MKGPAIFLAQFAGTKPPLDGYDGWAFLERECYLKHPEDGAREGAPFIRSHMIRRSRHALEDFATSATDPKVYARILGQDQ